LLICLKTPSNRANCAVYKVGEGAHMYYQQGTHLICDQAILI
jgi:hypothetical protein